MDPMIGRRTELCARHSTSNTGTRNNYDYQGPDGSKVLV
jgi:hypothetical protein